MLEQSLKDNFLAILKEELIPAMGCTEPISIAFAAAIVRKVLNCLPDEINVDVSGNIIKNVKSVIVPHTNGLRGIEAATAAGIIAGNPENMLEVLSVINEAMAQQITEYLKRECITVSKAQSDELFEITITAKAMEHSCKVSVIGGHTNVTLVQRDGEVLYSASRNAEQENGADRSGLSVERIVQYAEEVDIDDVKELLYRQIEYNTAIAQEGLTGKYGAAIGKILLNTYGNSVNNRAKAWAAAGSDARMNGCELPVVINSGSGNQGMTASLPVIVYARELNVSDEQLYRALVVSNLVTIRLKSGIGCLSAYCGAISAGCGAGAGVTFLYGGRYKEISHTIVNAVAINSGVVCDGAKASCAAKIASAVEAGLLGMHMYMHGSQFVGGDGIVTKGIEKTIDNVSELAREGMKETDKEILKIMLRR